MEMKIILLLTAPDFDFQPAYEPNDKAGLAEFGGIVYQMLNFSPKPPGQIPMKVKATHN